MFCQLMCVGVRVETRPNGTKIHYTTFEPYVKVKDPHLAGDQGIHKADVVLSSFEPSPYVPGRTYNLKIE